MLGHVKRLKPFRAVRNFIFFSSLRLLCPLWSVRSINLLPPPTTWGTQGIWLADVLEKEGIWQQWLLLGWRTWWHMGLEEDWNKLSQFHVKLCLVSLQRNTLIKLWRVWTSGKFVFVSVSPIFLVAVTKQVPGVGYMAAHLQQKNPF